MNVNISNSNSGLLVPDDPRQPERACEPLAKGEVNGSDSLSSDDQPPSMNRGIHIVMRNGLLNSLGLGIVIPLQAIGVFLLARRLPKEDFGQYFFLIALTAVVHFLSEAGVTVTLTRRIAARRDRLVELFQQAIVLWLACALLSTTLVLMTGWCWYWTNGVTPEWMTLLMFSGGLVAYQFFEWCSSVFRGVERFEFENACKVLQAIAFVAGIWMFVPVGSDVLDAGIVLFVSFLISAVAGGLLLHVTYAPFGISFQLGMTIGWLEESLPIGVFGLVRRLMWQLDTLLLDAFQTAAVVGVFSIAFRPLQPLQVVPVVMGAVTFPMMSRLAGESREQMAMVYERAQRALLVVSIPVCVLITRWADEFIVLCATEKYVDAVLPFQLMAWLIVLCFVSAQFRWVFTALGEQKRYAYLVGRIFIFKLLLSGLLIWFWGLVGACVGLLVSELMLVCMGTFACGKLGIHGVGWQRWIGAVWAGIGMLSVDQLLNGLFPDSITKCVLCGFASCLFYVLVLLVLRVVDREELAQLMRRVRA